jgi:hypothetical protein
LLDDTEGKRLAGVDTLEWLACQENVGTMDNDGTMAPLNLQVIVEFAGDKTQQKPYDPAFVNPHVYGIHIFLYNGGNNRTIFSYLGILLFILYNL